MVNVVIGTPVFPRGDYALDKFLTNQQQIQNISPACELVFATHERDFIASLESLLRSHSLRGTVLYYKVVKPPYARSYIWNIASGREIIRQHTLMQTKANLLLFLDADMTFDPAVITIMEQQIQGYDAIFSGYPLRNFGVGLAGNGCVMLTRDIMEKIYFRCYEFKNGEVIFEDNVLEMDLFSSGARIKKGFFVSINHYMNATMIKTIKPQSVGILRRAVNSNIIRYVLIRVSILLRYNIPWHLKIFLTRLLGILNEYH